jgi:hypothetical protein
VTRVALNAAGSGIIKRTRRPCYSCNKAGGPKDFLKDFLKATAIGVMLLAIMDDTHVGRIDPDRLP